MKARAGQMRRLTRPVNCLWEFEQALERARKQQQVDSPKQPSGMNAKAGDDERRKADEEAKKRKQELLQAEKQAAAYLRQAQLFELTGMERINALYREKLELLGRTPKAVADITAAHAMEVTRN